MNANLQVHGTRFVTVFAVVALVVSAATGCGSNGSGGGSGSPSKGQSAASFIRCLPTAIEPTSCAMPCDSAGLKSTFAFWGFGVSSTGAGAIELHGETLLHHGEIRGMSWLIGSQLCLLQHIEIDRRRVVHDVGVVFT